MSGLSPDGWEAKAFLISCDDHDDIDRHVAGWVKGVWGIDFRVFDREDGYYLGFYLNHIPTGYHAASLMAGRVEACMLADQINDLGDWNFTDAASAQSMKEKIKALADMSNGRITFWRAPSPCFSYDRPEVQAS